MSNRDEGIFSAPWIPQDMGIPNTAMHVRQITGAPPGYARSQVVSAASGLGAPVTSMRERTPCAAPPTGDSCEDAWRKHVCGLYIHYRCNHPGGVCVTDPVTGYHRFMSLCRRQAAMAMMAANPTMRQAR